MDVINSPNVEIENVSFKTYHRSALQIEKFFCESGLASFPSGGLLGRSGIHDPMNEVTQHTNSRLAEMMIKAIGPTRLI